VLGLFEGASYDEARVALGPGDMVILFSDGLPEAIDEAGNDFGDERIEALASACTALDAPAVLERVLAEVKQFCGNAPTRDDLTVVVVKYKG
jgi:sigma-B regulation protein RsbU (phosphoserine phosphatase)